MSTDAAAAAEPTPGFDGTVFRQVIGNFMSGVVVITASHERRSYGMTVSAISSLSLDPPMLTVCLNRSSGTQEAVRKSGAFGVNILAEDHGHLAERFAQSGGDKFAGVAIRTGHTGVPLLADALAVLECHVGDMVSAATHRVFLADVVRAEAREGSPLAYFRGTFGRFELAQDAATYQRLRDLVLSRSLEPGSTLDVQRLAEQLTASVSSVYYALTRLVADKLVRRDPEHGHVVAPLDAETSDDVHDAQLVMELGAAQLTVGRLSEAQLAELRRLAEETTPMIKDGRFTDVEAYIAANTRFHSYLIELTGIRALADAYAQLALQDIMGRALQGEVAISPDLAEDHRVLVDAYDRGDLDAAKGIIVVHNERAKATQRAGIERAGGRL